MTRDGSKNRLDFVGRGAVAYQQLVQMLDQKLRDEDNNPSASVRDDGVLKLTSSSALYDLGLNYLLRARLLCADSGGGSGLWAQGVYDQLPGVDELAR